MKEKDVLLYRIVRPIFTLLFRFLYWPTYINQEQIPKEGKVILAGTHSNNFDCIMVGTSTKRTVHYLGKVELFQGAKWKKWFFRSVGVIPVDRSQKKNHKAMESAEAVLHNQGIIGIFPEGTTRKEKGTLLPFKLGAVAMAQHTNSKIVPFAITENYRLFHRGLTVRYGSPIDVSGMPLEEANELLYREVIHLAKENKQLNEDWK